MDYGNVEVCSDCYMAHHFGAERVERPATEAEIVSREQEGNSYHDRQIMGLEWVDDETVAEWFAGESDQRCEGGEPLGDLPEYGHVSGGQKVTGIFDNTCSNHDVDQIAGEDCGYDDTTECPHCGQTGWENGITAFTWRSCDGCGSHLGGSRYRLAIHWEDI